MGGNVFPTLTRRFLADEYFKLSTEIIEMVSSVDNHWLQYEIIPAYREKESFGDCDILYSTTDDRPFNSSVFGAIFNTKNVSRNGNVTSIAYKELQIDFIHVPQEQFDYALSYFSWNDFGNLEGKLARYFGLKHGHNGLYLPLRDGDNKFDEILLTLDHDKTLKFIGLDSNVFNRGFDTLEEMFDYVTTSPYYSPEWYALENISSAGRMRDKKRDTYRKFLEYGTKYTGPVATKVYDKSVYLEHIFEFFPEALPKYKTAMQKLGMQKFVKDKFNGYLVSQVTGLKDKELGQFMKHLREDWYFSPENIVYMSNVQLWERVHNKFIDFHNQVL